MGNGTLLSYQSKFLAYLKKVSELQAYRLHYQIAQPLIVRLDQNTRYESRDELSLVDDSRLAEASRILVKCYGFDPEHPETLPEAVLKLKKKLKTYETCCESAFRNFVASHFEMFGGHKSTIYQFDPDATAEENLRKMHSLLSGSNSYCAARETSRLEFYAEKLKNYTYSSEHAPTPMWLETEFRRASDAAITYLVTSPIVAPATAASDK